MQAVTPASEPGGTLTGPRRAGRAVASSAVARHLAVLIGYLAAGIAVTWPRATYLPDGQLPATRDAGSYVWDLWWMAHQIQHLGNPWFTRSIAAPAGAQLGYHALMPLAGLVMAPVTLAFGATTSYNLLSIAMPGLLSYAMYRAARLWFRSQVAAIAAGAFFGLSSMLAWHAWYQLNLAVGVLFLPLALEAALRLRRHPGWPQAVILGVILGASLLTDQESAFLVAVLVILVLAPWLIGRVVSTGARRAVRASVSPQAAGTPTWQRKLAVTAAAAAVAIAVASPQIAAMLAQTRSGGASFPARAVGSAYLTYSAQLPWLFGGSPRLGQIHLTALKPVTYPPFIAGRYSFLDGVVTFGLVLTVLAVFGLVVSWRRRSARMLALLWLGSAALALGPTLKIGTHVYVPAAATWHGVRLSSLMPYTWFVKIPALAGFREAARISMLAIVPAALLAGAAVEWLRYHAALLVVPALILAVLELGWGGNQGIGTMPAALPRLDGPIAADHSSSLVVDIPFGIRGGIPLPGEGSAFNPEAQVLSTADGHPRAIGYLSRIPAPTLAAIRRHAFYDGLLSTEGQPRSVSESLAHVSSYPALLAAARLDARRMHVGWVIVWHQSPYVSRYLASTGFRFAYAADGVSVYRPAAG